jgi:hypothetical protein
MAVTHCKRRNEVVDVTTTDVTTTGIALEAQEQGDRMILMLTASAACTVTVKAGDAEVWGGLEDLSIPFAAAGSKAVCLDTARFKYVSGDNKGCIIVAADAAGKAKATLLVGC